MVSLLNVYCVSSPGILPMTTQYMTMKEKKEERWNIQFVTSVEQRKIDVLDGN